MIEPRFFGLKGLRGNKMFRTKIGNILLLKIKHIINKLNARSWQLKAK